MNYLFTQRFPVWQWGQHLLLVVGVLITACSPVEEGHSSGQTALQVVVTNTILADLTQQVATDRFEVISLLRPGDDPHLYEPVPQDTRTLSQADLILYNGYNLEAGLMRLLTTTGKPQIAIGEVVPPLDNADSPYPDPHVWGNVQNAIVMVDAIAIALSNLDPTEQTALTENQRAYQAELRTLDQWISDQIATIPPSQRKLVTTHDAFQYYAQAYGLEVIGTLIGISTEEQPSAQTVQQLVETVKAAQVPTIFAETTLNPQLIQTVATEAGVILADPPLYSDSISAPGGRGDSYIKMMQENTITIVSGLGGTLTP